MNTANLVDHIKAADLYPIRVDEDYDRIAGEGLQFIGSLDEFLRAAKAIGAQVVFFGVYVLEEDDFQHSPEDQEELDPDEAEDEAESFDLIEILPSLTDFWKHIGAECLFVLSANNLANAITLCLEEPWWTTFEQQREAAIQIIEEDEDADRQKASERSQKEEDNLIKKLRALLHDPDFYSITTQGGMKAYAIEQIPELEQIDDHRLKQEIQKLDGKIKSRRRRNH